MGFLNRLFGSSETNLSKVNWTALTDLHQLDEIVTLSYEKIVLIFKHSTRCGISRSLLNRFEQDYTYTNDHIEPYFLDLLAFREISNEIIRKFGIEHQSPQIIVLKNGKAIYSASHENIDASFLERFI